MKKKILYIHHGIGLGGAPLSLLYLIKSLDKEKFEPIVLFLHNSKVIELYRSEGIKIAGVVGLQDFSHSKIFWYRWYHFYLFARSLFDAFKTRFVVAKKWLNKIKPDIVHLNTSSLTTWAIVAKKMEIKVVFHVREPLADGYLGVRKSYIKKMVDKYSDAILPICCNDAVPWQGNKKVFVIPNPVEHNKFNKTIRADNFLKRYDIPQNSPKILFLGGLSKEKGTLEILKIFKQFLKLSPNSKLILAGYFDLNIKNKLNPKRYFPSQRYKLKVKKIVQFLKKNIIFTGPIKDVEKAILTSDLLVSPSVVGHFSRPIIEAGFMAKPVIATNIAPLDELVIHGSTGYLIDLKDKGVWIEKLFALTTNKSLNKKLGSANYDFCKKKFNLSDYGKSLEKIYVQLVS